MLPAVVAAKIRARLQTDVIGLRQQTLERGAQQAGAATGVEEPAHRQADVLGESRDEARTSIHFPAGRHRGARVVVVALVVLAIERQWGVHGSESSPASRAL